MDEAFDVFDEPWSVSPSQTFSKRKNHGAFAVLNTAVILGPFLTAVLALAMLGD